MGTERKYNEKFKVEAVKLAKKIGTKQAAEELGIQKNTLRGWISAKNGEIDTGNGSRSPGEALNLAKQSI